VGFLTKKEFCYQACMDRTQFPQYRKLGKIEIVVVGGKEMVDTSQPINSDFIRKRQEKYGAKFYKTYVEELDEPPVVETPQTIEATKKQVIEEIVIPIIEETKPHLEQIKPIIEEKPPIEVKRKQEPVKKKEPIKVEEAAPRQNTPSGLYEIDKKIKENQLKKTTEEIELLRLKKEKMQGEIIPIELAKSLFSQHNTSIVKSFSDAANDLITTISHKKRMNSEEVADLKGYLRKSLNAAIENALKQTELSIKHITDEFSEKKGRGER